MKRTAFTLIEILIVVILLGILAAIVVPQFTNTSQEANENACRQNMQTLRTQVELFKFREGAVPADAAAMVTAGYLESEPTCPADGAAYGFVLSDADSDGTNDTVTVSCPNGH